MNGYLDHNHPAFNAAAERLRAAGFDVVNPAELDADDDAPKINYIEYYIRDIPYLLTCDAGVALPGWERSTGAKMEVFILTTLNRPVYRLADLSPMKAHELPTLVFKNRAT
jgi:hypothetical protein